MTRHIVMDLELTTNFEAPEGLFALNCPESVVPNDEGKYNEIYEIALIELDENWEPTGKEFHSLVKPDNSIKDDFTNPERPYIHAFHDADVKDAPKFDAEFAEQVLDFINGDDGDSEIVITCRTALADKKNMFCATYDNMKAPAGSFDADVGALNAAFMKAGKKPLAEDRFNNIRRFSEAVFGYRDASLSKLAPHYGYKFTHHIASEDAAVTGKIAVKVFEDYKKGLATHKAAKEIGNIKPGAQNRPPQPM